MILWNPASAQWLHDIWTLARCWLSLRHFVAKLHDEWLYHGCRMPRERFFQFSWRPRPPTLLEPGQEEEIVKNLKKYSQKYEQEDQALLAQVNDLLQRPLIAVDAPLMAAHAPMVMQE